MYDKFTKSDLQTGDIVVKRNGNIEMYVKTPSGVESLVCGDGGWNDPSSLKEDLTHNIGREFDVMQVFRPTDRYQLRIGFENNDTLIWERKESKRTAKEPEEMTLEQVCKELGREIRIIA